MPFSGGSGAPRAEEWRGAWATAQGMQVRWGYGARRLGSPGAVTLLGKGCRTQPPLTESKGRPFSGAKQSMLPGQPWLGEGHSQ